MKAFLLFCLGLLSVASLSAETDLEKTFRAGIPGIYGRMDGMVYYSVRLRSDGTYIFSESGCLITERQKGKWSVSDDVVVLDQTQAGFRRFRIHAVSEPKSSALLPLEDDDIRKDDTEEQRLFTIRDEEANQPSEPTAPSGRGSH